MEMNIKLISAMYIFNNTALNKKKVNKNTTHNNSSQIAHRRWPTDGPSAAWTAAHRRTDAAVTG